MADLTLERIAELRVLHEKVRSSGWADAIKAMAEWSLQLRMSSDALLDAAERGLTGGWVRNGPDVEKPEGRCVIRLTQEVTSGSPYRAADWAKCYWKMTDDWPASDEFVTHFMELKEPTDG